LITNLDRSGSTEHAYGCGACTRAGRASQEVILPSDSEEKVMEMAGEQNGEI